MISGNSLLMLIHSADVQGSGAVSNTCTIYHYRICTATHHTQLKTNINTAWLYTLFH